MLQPHDQVPHFTVTTRDRAEAAYGALWQRKNLLLVLLPDTEPEAAAEYASRLDAQMLELTANDTACIVTGDDVPGAPNPGVLVADRWGEIYFVAGGERVAGLPPVSELLEWLRYVQHECPECQGETR